MKSAPIHLFNRVRAKLLNDLCWLIQFCWRPLRAPTESNLTSSSTFNIRNECHRCRCRAHIVFTSQNSKSTFTKTHKNSWQHQQKTNYKIKKKMHTKTMNKNQARIEKVFQLILSIFDVDCFQPMCFNGENLRCRLHQLSLPTPLIMILTMPRKKEKNNIQWTFHTFKSKRSGFNVAKYLYGFLYWIINGQSHEDASKAVTNICFPLLFSSTDTMHITLSITLSHKAIIANDLKRCFMVIFFNLFIVYSFATWTDQNDDGNNEYADCDRYNSQTTLA